MPGVELIIILIFLMPVLVFVFHHTDHVEPYDEDALDEKATIVDIKTTMIGKSSHFTTIIEFSDGFTFVAYDTKNTGRSLSVTTDMKMAMAKRAMEKHSKAVERARKKRRKA